ncbi:Hypothetical protein A7982_06498 [Minicystis rosea]|nr:Hypothetical protein A7982_06498 [Minicystis rosea]
MIRIARWAVLIVGGALVGASCARAGDAPVDAGAPSAPASASAAVPVGPADAGLADASLPEAGAPEMITDDECRARGGKVVTEKTYEHLNRRPRRPGEVVRPFRVCRIPSPENGKACRDKRDCGQGWCMCTGDLARPNPMLDPSLQKRDGEPATGVCSDAPLPSGMWWCLVGEGKAQLHGIIID